MGGGGEGGDWLRWNGGEEGGEGGGGWGGLAEREAGDPSGPTLATPKHSSFSEPTLRTPGRKNELCGTDARRDVLHTEYQNNIYIIYIYIYIYNMYNSYI